MLGILCNFASTKQIMKTIYDSSPNFQNESIGLERKKIRSDRLLETNFFVGLECNLSLACYGSYFVSQFAIIVLKIFEAFW